MKNTYFYETRIGKIIIVEENNQIVQISFEDKTAVIHENIKESTIILEAAKQIQEYLSSMRKDFDLPLNPSGTQFQKKVWEVLKSIPFGETWSYKQVAEAMGNKGLSRAVGMANHNNPIAIVIPCHRVIGSNGNLVGYAGGLELKKRLLELERECLY